MLRDAVPGSALGQLGQRPGVGPCKLLRPLPFFDLLLLALVERPVDQFVREFADARLGHRADSAFVTGLLDFELAGALVENQQLVQLAAGVQLQALVVEHV